MEAPYSYTFPKEIATVKVDNRLPGWSVHKLPLPSNVKHFELSPGEFVAQQLMKEPFFIELVEMEVKDHLPLTVKVSEDLVFLYFQLKGRVQLYDTDGALYMDISGNQFILCRLSAGYYKAQYSKGHNLSVVILMSADWILSIAADFPNLYEKILLFLNGSSRGEAFPRASIGKKINQLLNDVYIRMEHRALQDGLFRLFILQVLTFYDGMVGDLERQLPYRVRDFLDRHFTDQEVDVGFVAREFYVTKRTLNNQFKKTFNVTVYNYYTRLRLALARELLKKGIPIKDIYYTVGYKDERAFRYAFSKLKNK